MTSKDLADLKQFIVTTIDERFAVFEAKFDAKLEVFRTDINARFEENAIVFNEAMNAIGERFNEVDSRIDIISNKLDHVEEIVLL